MAFYKITIPVELFRLSHLRQYLAACVALSCFATVPIVADSEPSAAPSVEAPTNAGPNLALNMSYVCTDPNKGWNDGLTDGSWKEGKGTTFATGGHGKLMPTSVTIDLQQAHDVANVLLGTPAFGSTKTIIVSVSADGTDFEQVGIHVFTQKISDKCLYTFPAQLARYVRLTYIDFWSEDNVFPRSFCFTTEAEVYGPSK